MPAAAADRPSGLIRIATFNCSLNRGSARRAAARPVRRPAMRRRRSGRDHPARAARHPAVAGVRLRRRRRGRCATSRLTTSPSAERLAGHPFAHSFFTESNTGVPSGFDLNNDGRVQAARRAGLRRISRASTPWCCCRVSRSMRPRPHLPQVPLARHARCAVCLRAGIRPTNSPCCRCPRRATGTCRCASARRPCTCSRVIRRRRLSTDRKIATAGATTTRSVSGATTWMRAAYIRDDAGKRGGFRGKAFLIMGDQNSDPVDGGSLQRGHWRAARHPRVDCAFRTAERRRRRGQRRAGWRQCRAARRSALRHRRLQRPCRRQPARRLSTAFEGHHGLRRRRVLADADRSGRVTGLGRPPGAELGSSARVARRQRIRSSMPTGQ